MINQTAGHTVENVKLSVSGSAFGPEGGTRAPYALFTGKVSIEYLATMNLPVWIGEARVHKDLKIFGFHLSGQVMTNGVWHDFEYAALSNAQGKTLRRCGNPEHGTDTYKAIPTLMPTGSNYPYPTIYGWQDWEKAVGKSSPDPAGDWYGRPQVTPETEAWQKPWNCPGLGSGYLCSETADGAKVSTSLVIPGTEEWCLEYLLSRNSSTFRAYFHPDFGVRRSEVPVTEEGWKQLPPVIGMDYHSKESKRALVFRQTDWWNMDTTACSASELTDLLRDNKNATENWYAS